MKEISLILTTYNEENFIRVTLVQIFKILKNPEVIIVDDNSKDRTVKIIKEFKKKNKKKNIKLISRTKAKGLASAFMVGVYNANFKYVGWLDSNMSYVLKLFPFMKKKLDKNYDLVLLSRYISSGKDNRSALRVFCSLILNKFCQFYLTNKIKDFSSGMFLMKRSMLNEIVPLGYGYGEFFIEFIYKLSKANFKILEFPYTQHPDKIPGNSKTSPNILQFFKLCILYFLRVILSKIRSH